MDYVNTIPLAQFYEVSVDSATPYRVCGGLQDNGSWCGPSRTLDPRGISNDDWFRVGGGDGFYTVVDPADPDTVYVESQDGNVRALRPPHQPDADHPSPDPEGERYRFNWNSPILVSPHDHQTVYYGGNRLFGSKDRGETWTLVTPTSRTRRSGTSFPSSARRPRSSCRATTGSCTAAPSPPSRSRPCAAGSSGWGRTTATCRSHGTGAATWANVTGRIPGVPKGTYVSRVEASRRGRGRGLRDLRRPPRQRLQPYLYATDDFGQTWKAIAAGPARGRHPERRARAPEEGRCALRRARSAASACRGTGAGAWTRVKANLPTMPVDDIQVHPRENDLVLGTHGRGVWILDDATPLVEAPSGVVAGKDVELFDIRPAVQTRTYNGGGNSGHKAFFGDNPPEGALLTYFLKDKPGDKDKVRSRSRTRRARWCGRWTGPRSRA